MKPIGTFSNFDSQTMTVEIVLDKNNPNYKEFVGYIRENMPAKIYNQPPFNQFNLSLKHGPKRATYIQRLRCSLFGHDKKRIVTDYEITKATIREGVEVEHGFQLHFDGRADEMDIEYICLRCGKRWEEPSFLKKAHAYEEFGHEATPF